MSGTDAVNEAISAIGRAGGSPGHAARTRHEPYGPLRTTAARYALLPLRIFLGVTFIYAGLDKLTDPAFFAGSGPNALVTTLHAVRDNSAAPGLVDLALKSPSGFGHAIAFGELAVGLGAFFGLLTRLAAAGGALIS